MLNIAAQDNEEAFEFQARVEEKKTLCFQVLVAVALLVASLMPSQVFASSLGAQIFNDWVDGVDILAVVAIISLIIGLRILLIVLTNIFGSKELKIKRFAPWVNPILTTPAFEHKIGSSEILGQTAWVDTIDWKTESSVPGLELL